MEFYFKQNKIMRIFIIILLLLFSNSFVYSSSNIELNKDSDKVVVGPREYNNWEFVAYDKDMIFYYVDPTSILKKEEGLLFKELRDYSEPKEGGKSRVAFFFADCKKLAIREILVRIYKENGAEGSQIDAYKFKPKWLKVSTPNTIGNLILNYVCNYSES